MATIAKLVIGMETENSGLTRGLTKATNDVRGFTRTVEDAVSSSAARIEGLVDAMGQHITTVLDKMNTDGDKGGRALFTGFRNWIPQIEAATADAGERSGRSFAQTLTATIHRHRALIPTLAGLILGQGLASSGDIATATSGLERVVQSGNAAEKILENVAMLASFVLKPVPGLIVAVVGGAAAALVKIWTHAKEEMLKAQKEFMKDLNKMIDDIDQLGLQKKLQDVTVGKRSSGVSSIVPGQFAGGLNTLLEEQRREVAAIAFLDSRNKLANGLLSLDPVFMKSRTQLQDLVDKRKPIIANLQFQADELRNALLDPGTVKAGFGGQLPAAKTVATVFGDKATIDALEKTLSDIEKTHAALKDLHEPVTSLRPALHDVWAHATTALNEHNAVLAKTGKMYDDTSLRLEQLAAKAESLLLEDVLKLGVPGLLSPVRPGSPTVTLGGLRVPAPSVAPLPHTTLSGTSGLGPIDPLTGRRLGSLGGLSFPAPQVAQLPPQPTVNEARWRAIVSVVEDGLSSLGGTITDLAKSSIWATFRSIAGQLNPFSQVISAISTAAAPLVPEMTKIANIVAHTLGPVFTAFAPVLEALLPLLDAIFRVLSPILRALAPLFQALIPILNALFPVLKLAAIAFTYVVQGASFLAGVLFNIAGGIAVAIGGLIAAVGTVISKIPFLGGVGRDIRDFGNTIKNLGHGFEQTANGLFETADQMAKARAEIEGVNLDPTQTALDGLTNAADATTQALLNVPTGYKVALARFNATAPIASAGLTPTDHTGEPGVGGGGSFVGSSSSTSVSVGPGGIIIQAGNRNASELVDEMLAELQKRARAVFGDATRWAEVQQ